MRILKMMKPPREYRIGFALGLSIGVLATVAASMLVAGGEFDGSVALCAVAGLSGLALGTWVAMAACMVLVSRMTITVERDDDEADWWKSHSS